MLFGAIMRSAFADLHAKRRLPRRKAVVHPESLERCENASAEGKRDVRRRRSGQPCALRALLRGLNGSRTRRRALLIRLDR